jgi:WS/DGAT/MGAT family acyltransferase
MRDEEAPATEWGVDPSLNDVEALMWKAEASPRLRSAGVFVDLLDGAPDWDRLVAAHEWAIDLVPRLRQRVVDDPLRIGPPTWVIDDGFDLGYHLRRVRVPAPATFDEALTVAQSLAMSPLDRARPLWEAVLVEGLTDGRAAYLLKLHHSLTDGQAALQLFDLLHSSTPEPTPDKPRVAADVRRADSRARVVTRQLTGSIGAAWRTAGRALELGGDLVRRPQPTVTSGARFAGSLARVTGAPPAAPSPLMTNRGLSRRFGAIDLPLASLRAAGKAVGGSVNDAYLASLVGGLRHYHEAHGIEVGELPIAFPVSLRTDDHPMGGNRFAGARIAGPVGVAEPRDRIRVIRERVLAAREEPALDFMGFLAPALTRVPAPLLTRMTERMMRATDLQASNIAGLARPAFIAGAEILRMYPFAPVPGAAVMVTLVSHNGTCCIGINVDAAAVPDTDVFVASLRAGFAEVLALADEQLPDVSDTAHSTSGVGAG